MFESAELGHKIDKATFDAEEPKLREALLAAQFDLAVAKKTPVIVVIGGVDGAGKGETVNLLNEWMDPRQISVHAFPDPTDDERTHPWMGRFWRSLPPKGRIGILFGGWHSEPIVRRALRQTTPAELDQTIESVVRFERMLSDEGALLIKFWFHLSKERQRKRLKALAKDRDTRWRVTREDWERFAMYDRFRRVSEHYVRRTSTGEAPWIVIEGEDERYRSLTVGRTLVAAMRERLDDKPVDRLPDRTPPLIPAIDRRRVLGSLDLTLSVPKSRYEKRLEALQGRLNALSRHPKFRRISVIAAFEGSDAAGKGGAIRRITGALDARTYQVVSIAAPTEEERAQPYLWRFWRHVPRHGRFTIFDRSWYGRVLVERIEGFCKEADWMRAYPEINDFEDQLASSNCMVVKFWLQISKAEQMRRFKEREQTGFKRFKITDEDWRNRKRWNAYEIAADDMIERTSTDVAPWTLIEANDKRHARLKVLKTLCARIEAALERV